MRNLKGTKGCTLKPQASFVHPRPKEWLPCPRELSLPSAVRLSSFGMSRVCSTFRRIPGGRSGTCTDSYAHRACSFHLRHGKFLADPAAINSAQETLMKTSACLDPFSGSVQKQESQVHAQASPCVTIHDKWSPTGAGPFRQDHVASGDVHEPPGSGLRHPHIAAQQSGALAPTGPGHLASGAAPQIRAPRGAADEGIREQGWGQCRRLTPGTEDRRPACLAPHPGPASPPTPPRADRLTDA